VATRDDPDDPSGEALPEREGRVEGVLGALRAVGLLDADEAEAWRLRLTGPGVERPAPSDKARQAAAQLLQELLEAVPAEDEGRGDDFMRFEGALDALRRSAQRLVSGTTAGPGGWAGPRRPRWRS
jgi:hypothetical protein